MQPVSVPQSGRTAPHKGPRTIDFRDGDRVVRGVRRSEGEEKNYPQISQMAADEIGLSLLSV